MRLSCTQKLERVVEFNSSQLITSIGWALVPKWCSPMALSTVGRLGMELGMLPSDLQKLERFVEFNSSQLITSIGGALVPKWCSPMALSTVGRLCMELVMLP